MTDIPIPYEALEAGAKASHQSWREDCSYGAKEPIANWREWGELDQDEQADWRGQARAAFLAIVENWEGSKTIFYDIRHALILPLTEPTDDKA